MASSFRFGPPAPRLDLLTRPRLLRALLARWERQVVVVVGGPGLGKTTLLGQAVAENLLAPRGDDVWIGIEARDAEGDSLGRAIARQRHRPGGGRRPPRRRRPAVAAVAHRRLPGPRRHPPAGARRRRRPLAERAGRSPPGQRPPRAGRPDRSAGAPGPAAQPGRGPRGGRGRAALLRRGAGRLRLPARRRSRPVPGHGRLAGHGRAGGQRGKRGTAAGRRLRLGGGARTSRTRAPAGPGRGVRPGRRRRRSGRGGAGHAGRPRPGLRRGAARGGGRRRLAGAPRPVARRARHRPRRGRPGRGPPGRGRAPGRTGPVRRRLRPGGRGGPLGPGPGRAAGRLPRQRPAHLGTAAALAVGQPRRGPLLAGRLPGGGDARRLHGAPRRLRSAAGRRRPVPGRRRRRRRAGRVGRAGAGGLVAAGPRGRAAGGAPGERAGRDRASPGPGPGRVRAGRRRRPGRRRRRRPGRHGQHRTGRARRRVDGIVALARGTGAAVRRSAPGGARPARRHRRRRRSGHPRHRRDLRTGALSGLGRVDEALALLPRAVELQAAAGVAQNHRLAKGPALLEVLGGAGREAVRARAEGQDDRLAKQARSLLAAVPGPPPGVVSVAVLGPLELRRHGAGPEASEGAGGAELGDHDLRRERVRTLLAFLVGHRTTTRADVTAALWPDLDERAAANNLRVTLNYLLRVLEPWRPAGEPAYLVRVDGQRITLIAGDELRVDVDLFDRHLDAAARAEVDGVPSLALSHYLGAVDLYRGPLHVDVPDADWIDLDREHYRTRFVRAAVRAGQLLLGHGDLDHAETTARRAIDVDRWAEEAYAVLAAAALARGDRSAARRHLDRALAALAELGVEASAATQQLRRRTRS